MRVKACFVSMILPFFFAIRSLNPLSGNATKWSYTQTIRRQIANELFDCVWPFCGVVA